MVLLVLHGSVVDLVMGSTMSIFMNIDWEILHVSHIGPHITWTWDVPLKRLDQIIYATWSGLYIFLISIIFLLP